MLRVCFVLLSISLPESTKLQLFDNIIKLSYIKICKIKSIKLICTKSCIKICTKAV